MIIVMRQDATLVQIKEVVKTARRKGHNPHSDKGVERTIIGCRLGSKHKTPALIDFYRRFGGVEDVQFLTKPFSQVAWEARANPERFSVRISKEVVVSAGRFVVIAGPCAAENRRMVFEIAKQVKAAGCHCLRGGAFKPRTSPYDFRGRGEQALIWLKEASQKYNLPVVTEAMTIEQVALVSQYASVVQIGARNCQNYDLLEAAGQNGLPVLFKRGMAVTVDEWLKAAEYILNKGNSRVILCERGLRGFDQTYCRYSLDLGAVMAIKAKRLTFLPVFVDPSHAAGDRELVIPFAKASVAAGADGLMVEVHSNPHQAKCDGPQSLTIDQLYQLMEAITPLVQLMGKVL